jgi:hypothetical protein
MAISTPPFEIAYARRALPELTRHTLAMELPGVPNDTRREIERRVLEGLRRLGPEGRLEQTMALWRAVDELAEAGIRLREGPLDAQQLRSRLAVLRYGQALVARVEAHRASRGGQDGSRRP